MLTFVLAVLSALVWGYALARVYRTGDVRWHRIAAACACTCPEPYLSLFARAATPSCIRCRGVIRA